MVVVQGRIDGWRNDSPKVDSLCEFQRFGPPPDSGNYAVRKHCTGILRLDNAFVLIDGHPEDQHRPKGCVTRLGAVSCGHALSR
jgi:hypothetical protein